MNKKTQISENYKYFSFFQTFSQCVIKLHSSIASKEDGQKNKLRKQCSKVPSKTLIQSQCLYCQLGTMFTHVICLKFKNIQYIQR